MRKLLVVLVCTVASGWVLCRPALSQTDLRDDSQLFLAGSAWNHNPDSHVVPIAAIGVPGTSDDSPFVNFDQARPSIPNYNCSSYLAARRRPSP